MEYIIIQYVEFYSISSSVLVKYAPCYVPVFIFNHWWGNQGARGVQPPMKSYIEVLIIREIFVIKIFVLNFI